MCNRGSSITKKELEYVRTLTEEQYSLYEDYLRMAKNTNKYPGGLYPKSLKQSHDVLVTYINQLREAKNNLVFEEAVQDESYLSLLYEEPKYSILAPRTANDLVNESYQLSHCVRSYISRVATRQTRIYFMRLNLQKAKPLITIEVNGDRIVQVRGKANREPNGEENNFVYRWAIEKSLVY